MKIYNLCPLKHLKAIIIRRYITIKRSWKSILLSALGTCICSGLGIAFYWMMISWIDPPITPVSFSIYNEKFLDFAIVGNRNNQYVSNITDLLRNLYIRDTNRQPNFLYFNELNEMQEYFYKNYDKNIVFGLDLTSAPSDVLILYNDTYYNDDKLISVILFGESLWINEFNSNPISISSMNSSNYSDITFEYSSLYENMAKAIFSGFGPFLIVAGLLTCIPLLVFPTISDIRGEIRQYMMQCTLRLFPYWLGTFIVDLSIWIIITTFVWAIFNMGMIQSFHDNLFTTWYLLVFSGPSMILFFYCVSFCFSDPLSAPRIMYLIFIFMILIATVSNMIIGGTNPVGLEWFWSLIPPISLVQILAIVIRNMGYNKLAFSSYWHRKHSIPYMVMQWCDIVLYGLILTIIEMNRIGIQRRLAKRKYTNYAYYFKQIKNQNFQSNEAKQMEEDVHKSDDWAVRIRDLSRLFINTHNKPIPAVNNVSFGVKEFSIFGFLGANGAGKTTLIRMITGALPPSSGTIELFGKEIDDIEDQTIISMCPQFNNHLFQLLTPIEHFKIYSLLFQMDDEDTEDIVEDLISGMELNDFEDTPVCQLSLGDARKLGIALSFFGPSKLLILDEPTASLDPVARRCVQQMILEHKGEKTFMLCTHILSEAEFLCDVISIMVRGNIYTIGSPQYLTEKFGKEYRIDIELDDNSNECHRKVSNFFINELPGAYLNIQRTKSQIYSISDSVISLADLFKVMQNGLDTNNGFNYFTCSSSSLEKVFLEIVHRSETTRPYEDDDEFEENYYNINDLHECPTSDQLNEPKVTNSVYGRMELEDSNNYL